MLCQYLPSCDKSPLVMVQNSFYLLLKSANILLRFFFFFFAFILLIWLCWFLIAAWALFQLWRAGTTLQLQCMGFSWLWLLLQSTGSRVCRLQLLRLLDSRTQAQQIWLSFSAACGIFPHQGLNPYLLYWQADSLLLNHQETPVEDSYVSIHKDMVVCSSVYFCNIFLCFQYVGNTGLIRINWDMFPPFLFIRKVCEELVIILLMFGRIHQ